MASKQISGYMQSRSNIRPIHVDTLLSKDLSKKPSDIFPPSPEEQFNTSLVEQAGGEFSKQAAPTTQPDKSTLSPSKCALCDNQATKAVEVINRDPIPACPEHVSQIRQAYDDQFINIAEWSQKNRSQEKTATKRTCMHENCDQPADRGVVWADGRGVAICCQKHVPYMKSKLSEVVAVKHYDPNAPKGKRLSPLRMTEKAKREVELRDLELKLKRIPRTNRSGQKVNVQERRALSDRMLDLLDKSIRGKKADKAKNQFALKGSAKERFVQSRSPKKEKISADQAAAKSPREFAPGIPAKRVIKPIPKVSEKSPNQEWTVSLSKHPAAVRGDHHDLRLVDQKGKAHSWAFQNIPPPGKGTYAPQQATHTKAYALRKKPFTIPPGYGATRPGAKVEPKYVQPAEIISANKDRVHFLRHHGQETDEFILRRIAQPPNGQPMWTLNNATKTRQTREGKLLPDHKPKYKEISPDQIDLKDDDQVMSPKLDGAHALVHFPDDKKMMRVFSYRPTARQSGLIEHTFKFPGFQNRKAKGLKGTIIRAEVWGSKNGRAIPANELGSILNSSVPRSRNIQRDRKIALNLTGIDVVRFRGKDFSKKPYGEKMRVIQQAAKASKGAVQSPIIARTTSEKRSLLNRIKAGKLPDTKEGVVLHELSKDAPFTKIKFKSDHDVYLRGVYSTPGKEQAAGFTYSYEPDGPIAGRVGTGFSNKMRKDMFKSPEKYVGRVAKVRSQEKYKSTSQLGALRAPAFKEWHIDRTPPELMKEAAPAHSPYIEDIFSEVEEEADPRKLLQRVSSMPRFRGLRGLFQADPVKRSVGEISQEYHKMLKKRQQPKSDQYSFSPQTPPHKYPR